MSKLLKSATFFWVVFFLCGISSADDGPDPVAHWNFSERDIKGKKLVSRLGPNGYFSENPVLVKDQYGESVRYRGGKQCLLIENKFDSPNRKLPTKNITVSAWVSLDEGQTWGGIAGTIQDNRDFEKGWLLGYDDETFSFALSTKGADDGNGKLTYLKGKTKYRLGKFYHVAGVYDGKTMQLFVNGKLEAESQAQSGDILYPEKSDFVIGGYKDQDEFHAFRGRIRSVALFSNAAKWKWVANHFATQKTLINLASDIPEELFAHSVKPFLQYGTKESMTVVWRSSQKSSGSVFWGETFECKNEVPNKEPSFIHQVKLSGLKENTQYFYCVESKREDGLKIRSKVKTFQTAVGDDTPFAFAVISDTQGNPKVSGELAKAAWNQRPNFLMIPGDLVDTGTVARQWTDDFFSSMDPLISRVPFFPVLGNHERNAKNYFDYMALPKPEYYYRFRYGNIDFFMIDSNRKVHKQSEQYKWLDKALASSGAKWKIVCHHHPPFSSDDNDYGNLWKGNRSTRGDTRVRQLVPLYEKHKVDIVWNGHIHSYERTWPIKKGKAVNRNGVTYMITGGGGGPLENPAPTRPFFQNNVKRGHHYCMVYVNGNTIELKSFDLEGRLFDYAKFEK